MRPEDRRAGLRPSCEILSLFSAFDSDKGLFRFDLTRPVIREIAGEVVPHQDASKYVRTPELAITWISPWEHKNHARHTAVGIYPPTLKLRTQIISSRDVRYLGLIL